MSIVVVIAVIEAMALSAIVLQLFRMKNNQAEAGKTNAEAESILAAASETVIRLMQAALDTQTARINTLELRVQSLEHELGLYRTTHGPLPSNTGVPFTGTIETVEGHAV